MAMAIQTSVSVAPAKGYAGTLDPAYPSVLVSAQNAEASASIPFGKAVVYDPSSPAHDFSATLPAAETNTVMGIVVHSHHYARAWIDQSGTTHGELDATGLRPGTTFTVARKGRMLVTAASTVVAGVSKLWVRAVAGLGETLGALEDADDSTDMIDCTTQGRWVSNASAGELAWLEFDFTA